MANNEVKGTVFPGIGWVEDGSLTLASFHHALMRDRAKAGLPNGEAGARVLCDELTVVIGGIADAAGERLDLLAAEFRGEAPAGVVAEPTPAPEPDVPPIPSGPATEFPH